MTANSPPIRRWTGYAIIALIWVGFISVLAFLVVVFAFYRDMKHPQTSHLTEHGCLGFEWMCVYERNFMPLWSGDLQATRYDPALIYVPKVGVSHSHAPDFDVTMTMDEPGVRRQQTDPKVADNLVVVAGDSFALGFGVEDKQTFSSILERRYALHTVNTGVASYGTAREMYRLHELGLLRKASVLVIQYCANDGPENAAYLQDPTNFFTHRDTLATWRQLTAYHQRPVTYWNVLTATVRYGWERIGRDSPRSFWRELKTEREPRMRRYPPPAPEAAANFLAVLDKYPELDGKPIVVTEMNLFHYASDFLPELARLAQNRPNFHIVPITFTADDIFRLDGHINARGHATAAAALAPVIRPLVSGKANAN